MAVDNQQGRYLRGMGSAPQDIEGELQALGLNPGQLGQLYQYLTANGMLPGMGAGASPAADYWAQLAGAQMNYLGQQYQLQNTLGGAQQDAIMARLRAQESNNMADLDAQRQNIGINTNLALGNLARQNAQQTDAMRSSLAGRGLADSGIRLGQEAQQATNYNRAYGATQLGAQQQQDALTRQIANLGSQTALGLSEAAARKRAYQQALGSTPVFDPSQVAF
jgi:hypothetical protein